MMSHPGSTSVNQNDTSAAVVIFLPPMVCSSAMCLNLSSEVSSITLPLSDKLFISTSSFSDGLKLVEAITR